MASKQREVLMRYGLASLGVAVLFYCVALLGYVATGPDLRMRFLLVDEPDEFAAKAAPPTGGILIQKLVGLEAVKGLSPDVGDRLLRLNGESILTSSDYFRVQRSLRSAQLPPGGVMLAGADPLKKDFPPLVADENGARWVEAEYWRSTSDSVQRCYLSVQSAPIEEVSLTLVWFLFQLVISSLGALSFWSRPFDRAARLFFAMCVATLGAFVGSFHWWAVAGQFWLTVPFAVCAILLPVVTLHFFLVYPRPNPILTNLGRWRFVVLYALPMLAVAAFLFAEAVICAGPRPTDLAARADFELGMLGSLRTGVYSYLSVASLYFVATLVALGFSAVTTKNPVEQQQIRWILYAAFAATVCIAYTLGLAVVSRADFALGGGTIPMFTASLVFMLAYAIGISRYKLMLVDQVVSRGMWYYVLSYGSFGFFAVVTTLAAILATAWKSQLTISQMSLLGALLAVAVGMLMWLRDVWQRWVDRRFFREKYQLDKALQRINRSVGQIADAQSLSERMAGSCRDVLHSTRAALFLREGKTAVFRLSAGQGEQMQFPMQVSVVDEFVSRLLIEPTITAVPSGSRASLSPVQRVLRELHADLVHSLQIDQELVGLVVLGPKVGGGLYSGEDVTFLSAMGQVTSVALNCVKIHQQMSRLNEEMRLKADRINQQKQQIVVLQAELAAGRPLPTTEGAATFQRQEIRGSSPALDQVLEVVRKAAPTSSTILIRGESGTGKEMLARAVHENSPRKHGPLVSVHCASLSPTLLESELFGHVRGAFTGAVTDKIGRFELASGGTLFLDEIGDISLETQVKLLRVLQERQFEAVGSSKTVEIDVRVVTATHQNLEALIAQGKFREDLYYRLNVVSLHLPPLRERQDDVVELAMYFLRQAAVKTRKNVAEIDDEAMKAMLSYRWPGNIRELQNVMERAVVLASTDVVQVADLPTAIRAAAAAADAPDRWTAKSPDASGYLEDKSPSSKKPGNSDSSFFRPGNRAASALSDDSRSGLGRSPAAKTGVAGDSPSAGGTDRRSALDRQVSLQAPASAGTAIPLVRDLAETGEAPAHAMAEGFLPELACVLAGMNRQVDLAALTEQQLVVLALDVCGDNKAAAARLLGVPRSTLFSRMKKYRLQ